MDADISNGSIETIIVQFSFNRATRVPSWLYEEARETGTERKHRKRNKKFVPLPGGALKVVSEEQFIAPTHRVNVSEFPDDVMGSGFVLADAFAKPRIDGKNHRKTYYMCRFTFERKAPEGVNAFWKEMLEGKLLDAFRDLCTPCWRVRAYHQRGDGTRGRININMEVCTEGLLPHQRSHTLRIKEDVVQLVPMYAVREAV